MRKSCEYCGALEGVKHNPSCPIVRGIDGVAVDKYRLDIPIPPEVEQYAPEIRRFVEAMVYKLGVHAKKGKWENQTIESRLPKLEGEVTELKEAIQRGNMVEVLLEAADVANYALIISAKAME